MFGGAQAICLLEWDRVILVLEGAIDICLLAVTVAGARAIRRVAGTETRSRRTTVCWRGVEGAMMGGFGGVDGARNGGLEMLDEVR